MGHPQLIFSRLGAAVGNDAEHGIQSVSGFGQFHIYRWKADRSEASIKWTEVDHIFLGGDEAIGVVKVAECQNFGDVAFGVTMMVAIELVAGDLNSRGSQLVEETLRTSNAAEDEGTVQLHLRRNRQRALYPPNELASRKILRVNIFRKDDGIRPTEA